MEGVGITIGFWAMAGLTLSSAAMIIVVRNLLHAVLFLILSFVGVAGVYITLSADFVAVSQVLIYAGAIAVLMIFAVMLSPRSDRDNAENHLRFPALMLAAMLIAGVAFIAFQTNWSEASGAPFDTTATAIGEALLSPFVLPFEIASVLLVVAMVGAIVLVREDE